MNKLFKHNHRTSPGKFTWKARKCSSLLRYSGLGILTLGSLAVFNAIWQAAESGAVGYMLLLGYEMECLVAGFAIWIGGGLLLDYLERQNAQK